MTWIIKFLAAIYKVPQVYDWKPVQNRFKKILCKMRIATKQKLFRIGKVIHSRFLKFEKPSFISRDRIFEIFFPQNLAIFVVENGRINLFCTIRLETPSLF